MPHLTRTLTPAGGLLRRHAVTLLVAAVGLVCSLAAWRAVRETSRTQELGRLREVVETRTSALRDRLSSYAALLRAGRGLLDVLAREPTEEEFRAFVEALDLPGHSPGVQGIGWARLLLPVEVPGHEAEQRSLGHRDFRVWPDGARRVYSSIDLLEPLDWRNRRALGFDMYAEPIRRAAMDEAADSGEVAATAKVELVQEQGEERQAGFLMYVAVYRGAPRAAPDQERLLRGWIYAPFRVTDLVRGVLGPDDPTVRLEIFDAAEPDPERLLMAGGPAVASPVAVREARLEVGGRPWLLRFEAAPAFVSAGEEVFPYAALVLGLALTALMTWVTHGQATARRRAERASRRNAFLADASQALAASLDPHRTLEDVVDLAASRLGVACAACLVGPNGERWMAAHADPALAARLREALAAEGLDAQGRSGLGAALRARTALLLAGEAAGPLAQARTPALRAVLRELGAGAVIHVPLVARGERLGGVSLLARGRRALDAEDLALAADLGRLVSAAVDTARLYRGAQEAIQARDEFLSIASHELKTPLTSLALQSDSLRAVARRSQNGQLAGKAEVVRRNVDRLARLVASLLDISRITAGRLELELEDVDLAGVTREVAQRFEEEARRAGCRLDVAVEDGVVGRWDRLRLDQVVTNLLSNAIKYGPGQPVELRVEGRGERATLTVRDRGIGIAHADQPRIFERFERAVSKRNYGGFGLGLWIVRQLVEAMGGTVRVESAPGEGATFTVELTCAPGARPRPGLHVAPGEGDPPHRADGDAGGVGAPGEG